jgi:RHS repeat-associated protein
MQSGVRRQDFLRFPQRDLAEGGEMRTRLRIAAAVIATLMWVAAARAADSFAIPSSLASQAVFSCGDMSITGGGTIDSAGIASSGPTNRGTVRSNGKITNSSSTINGDATPGPGKTVTISGSGVVTGATTPAASSVPCTPINLSALATSLAASNNDAAIPLTGQGKSVLAGASHTEFSMSGGDTLTLPAGTYYFTKFTVSGGSTITLGGAVRILVTGNVSVSGGSFVNSNAYGFRFWHSGATFSLSSSTFTGIVYAPAASLTISSSRFIGSVFADAVTVSGGSSHVTRSIDDVAPSVSITSPANGAGVSDPSQVVVRGTVSDAQTDVTVAVNGQAATIAADGGWQVTLNLTGSASPATVSAVATDAAGNSSSAAIAIVTAAPSISLVTPPPGALVGTRIVNLSGAAGTATSVTVNGTAASIAAGSWSLSNFDLGADGSHTLTITGINGAGATTISPILTSDTTQPVVNAAVTPLPNAAGWNKSNATVTFTCSDVTSAIASCPPQVVISTETASQTVSGTATDAAGNHAAASVTVKLDKTAPTLSITAPAAGTTVTSAGLDVSGTATDALSSIATVTCNGAAASVASGTFTCSVTLAAGDNVVTVTATDVAGNPTTATVAVTYNRDSQPPAVAITAPVNGTFTKNNSVTVGGTASDDVAVAGVTVNGTPAAFANGAWSATITLSGGDGAKTITAIATDTSNKQSSANVTITFDTTPPNVAITAPATGATTASSSLSISGTVSDALSPATVSCNGVAATVSGGNFSCVVALVAGDNVVTATATDLAGNSAASTIHATYAPDAQAPTVAITSPVNGTFTNAASITVTGTASDDVAVARVTVNDTDAVLANGSWSATITLSGGDGAKTITATATDTTNKSTSASVQITLDTAAPVLTIETPASGAVVANPALTISGTVSDALTGIAGVTCNGAPATVSTGIVTCSVSLTEGSNTVTIAATDNAGNVTAKSLPVMLDTRAPDLAITAPAANACLNAPQIAVSGRTFDPHMASVAVSLSSGPPVSATVAADGNWTAVLTAPADGRYVIAAEGSDSVGHRVTATAAVTVDTIKPSVQTGESGGIVNHPMSIAFRAVDSDPTAVATATLNGQPYASGSTIAADGDYTLRITARDCAGNTSDVRTITFTIDTVAPSIVSMTPADGASIGSASQSIGGTVDSDDVASVVISGTPYAATITGRNFTFTGVALAEGINRFAMVATDRAGNVSTKSYALNVKSTTPVVDILESGAPIAAGTLFNRAVVPVVRVTESAASISATLNGAPFTSGTTISTDGSYTLRATASDSFGHTSNEATATFTVDTTPPVVKITSPASGATVHADHVTVSGTVTGGDIARVTVAGITVTPAADGTFTISVPLENGPNVITVTAIDRAGNSGSDAVSVTSDAARAGIILTLPVDQLLTNRITTVVVGQVLTPALATSVTLNGVPITIDSVGVFRKDAFPLVEGDNTITASVTDKSGTINSVTVQVPLDSAPPRLRVKSNGDDLTQGARFATAPSITLEATDANSVSTTLTVDGIAVTQPFTPTNGGHALTAIAKDIAGNETRIDRTFTVGEASTGGCPPANFDPPDRTSILADHVMLTGRAAAAAVLVGTAVVPVVDGAFATSVPLTVEGANAISITCADASGHALGDAASLTLFRYTNAPSITITSPATDSELTADKTQVAITVGPGVASGDVNGIAFTVAGDSSVSHSLTIDNVPVTNGLNIITARARNTAGRVSFASIQVRRYAGEPQLTITSPIPGTQTGAASVSVSGAYANIDLATLAVSAGALSYPVQVHATSDTTGTFVAAVVPIAAAQTTTVTATARNRASGTPVTAMVDIQNVSGAPSIVITNPADNSYFRADAPKPTVTGTFAAAPAATVQVNGNVVPPVDSSFSTTVDFASGSSGLTPIVARVANADGTNATASIRVVRLGAPLAVADSYPSQNATDVDAGVLLLILFNNPIDKSSITAGALRLADTSGAEVTGTFFVDRDALSFAPRVPLALATRYTFTVSQTLKDVAGGTLASPFVLSFTTASSAPSIAPAITPTDVTGCFTTYTIHGTASAAGARMQLSIDGLTQPATAANDKTFSFTVDLAPGVHIARVRELGADGTLSPETAVTIHVTCSTLQVVSASLDRAAKTVTIRFSRPMKPESLTASPTGTIQITPAGGSAVTGTVVLNSDVATVTTTADLSAATVTLIVKKTVQDTTGGGLTADYTQLFSATGDAPIEPGNGYVSGGVYDATTGRPLANANVAIDTPVTAFKLHPTSSATICAICGSSSAGHYTRSLPEGAYTIEVSAAGYTTAWRQVVVKAGVGIIPIDIRLTRRGAAQPINANAVTISAAADTTVTHAAELTIPSASALASHTVALTPAGAQSLAGLLPLGWSPLAAAEIAIDGSAAPSPMAGAQLTFILSPADVAAIAPSNQTLSLADYDSGRDEWRVVVAAVPPAVNNRVTFTLARSGNYALVYPDRGAGLTIPPPVTAGAALQGVAAFTSCAITSRGFTLDPITILPNGSTTATLRTDPAPAYPSGTAVQAYVDEQLNLADGRVILDPPFATDLLLYRSLTNDAGVAVFHLAPTPTAAAETLRDGVDHIRIVDYPGRVDRGALIGAEGGRVPGDGGVTVEIPAGAAAQPLRATVTNFGASDLAAIGSIAGFHVAGGFTFSLADTNGAAIVSLLKPARATFAVDTAKFASANRQVIVAELLSNTPYGAMPRLAAVTSIIPNDAAMLFTTRNVPTAELPIDGIVRGGRYVILTADAPIAFSFGQVHAGDATAPSVPNARVTASPLGVTDLTRAGGVFVVPVPAAPASQFALIARTNGTGDGDPLLGTSIPAADAFVNFGVLPLLAPPLAMPVLTPADGAVLSADAPFTPQAQFATTIDSTSVANGITITNLTNGHVLAGTTIAAGSTVAFHTNETLDAGARYVLAVAPTIRSVAGRLFGRTAVSHFSTSSIAPSNTTIHPEKIRITIPDANGISIITGAPGALPVGDQALAVRRGAAFADAPQTTVTNSDGSFSFSAGDVSTTDAIDLEVIDRVSHAIVAIIPLTPFVTADGTGFIAPVGVTATFTAAPLNVAVTVPAGAFATPTLVQLSAGSPAEFSNIPNLNSELHLSAELHVDFEGTAQKPLQLSIPAPADASASKSYFLGSLGHSIRGPRIEIIDTLRLAGGNFTTTLDSATAPVRIASGVHKQGTFASPSDVKRILGGVTRRAALGVVDMAIPVGWAAVSGAAEGSELFWDSIQSLFVSSYTLSRNAGRALIPVAADKPFTVSGIDASTGLQMYLKVYAGVAPGDPLGAVVLDPSSDNDIGPIPVFASPARIEIVGVPDGGFTLTSLRNLNLKFDKGSVTISAGAPAPPTKTAVDVFNPARHQFQHVNDVTTTPITLTAQTGDRLIIAMSEQDVDADTPVAVSFNKRMYVGGATDDASVAAYLKSLITVKTDDGSQSTDITEQVKFSADSDGHRITLNFGGALHLGTRYTIVLSKDLADASGTGGAPGLKLGESKINGQSSGPLPSDVTLSFTVRKPAGRIAALTLIDQGSVIHDMAMNGNLAFVAAGNGGLQAYDLSDPAKLDGTQPPLSASVDCSWNGSTQTFSPCSFAYWAVATDRHGRIVTTGMSGLSGSLRTFRVNDFINPSAQDNVPPLPRYVPAEKQVGGTPISWMPGVNAQMPIGSEILLGDKPEAIPRRVQLLLQDDEVKLTRAQLIAKYGGSKSDLANGYQKLTLTMTPDHPAYQWQSITIENRTLKLRWSVDVPHNGSRQLTGVIAGADDDLYVIVNRTTYAAVALFGFGIGVYDVNAIESNDRPLDAGYQPAAEIVALTKGNDDDVFDPASVHQCDQSALAASGVPCAIRDLTFAPDALLRAGSSPNPQVFALEQRRGVFDGRLTPPAADAARGRIDAAAGLALTSPYQSPNGYDSLDQPRLRTLRNLYKQVGHIDAHDVRPVARYTNIAYYARPPTADAAGAEYALIASFQYGLLVVKLDDAALDPSALADVVWIPAGAASVRVMPRGDLAVVVDGAGRVLLVDLTRIDESSKVPPLTPCSSATCSDALFTTAAASLTKSAQPLPADADWTEVGVDDPRILWKSDPHLVHGTLAPLVDPDTGIIFTGGLDPSSTRAEINTIAATDPRVRFMVNTGDASGDRETGGIVPLGIAPPPNVSLTGPDASLAAFRVEAWLPGAITEKLAQSNNELRIAIESERVLGVTSDQTVAPLPPSHLRHADAFGHTDTRVTAFKLDRLVPYDAADPDMKLIRYQEGFNRFVSPWIVAIADPRASIDYKVSEWTSLSAADKAKLGCYSCNRPAFLDPAKTTNVYELLTTGRFISARPEASLFAGTLYGYLGASNRLRGRVSTVMADTIRPTTVLTAADAPPVAGGALQATTFLHSGEVLTSALDLDAGGRAGWNVAFDRSYRSRTLLPSFLGNGWESALFARLRQLPNGDVEYRDGSGEIWRFLKTSASYVAPAGLSLKLDATSSGWRLLDQKLRITNFDALGRIVDESDQFFDGNGGGNVIRYFYDDHGRLGTVVDPVGRVSKLSYFDDCTNAQDCFAGLLHEITDWRDRKVTFHYDAKGNLIAVDKPEAKNPEYGSFAQTGSNRPTVHYTYKSAGASLHDFVDLASDLETIRDPADATPRVTFHYDDSGLKRDFVKTQDWGTADHPTATFNFDTAALTSLPSAVSVTDTRNQHRSYTFTATTPTDYNVDRVHLHDITEDNVASWNGSAFGQNPAAVSKDDVAHVATANRITTFGYENGRLKNVSTNGGGSTTLGYENARGGDIGRMLHTIDATGGAGASSRTINHANDLAFVASTQADGTDALATDEAQRGHLNPSAINAGVTSSAEHFANGLPHIAASTGDGPGSKQKIEYYDAADANLFKRSMPSDVSAGNDDVKSHIDYPSADQSVEHAPRGVVSTIDYDETGRPIHIQSAGKELTPEEWFAYDKNGRVARHKRKQGDKQIEQRFEYDLAGRLTKQSLFDSATEAESTTTDYFVERPNAITTHLPGGATITDTIDALGRVTRSETDPHHANATAIITTTLYDVEDNAAYVTDGKAATVSAYDSVHRARKTLTSDGTLTDLVSVDGLNRTRSASVKNGAATLSTFGASYSGPQLQHVDDNARKADFTWDGAGRTKSAALTGAEQPRASHTTYDTAGRIVEDKFGEGDATSLTREWAKTSYGYAGANNEVPVSSTSTEDTHSQNWTFDHDTLGQPTHAGIDGSGFNFDHHFDESGNVVSSTTPSRRGTTSYDYDARSFTTNEHLPSTLNPNKYEPDASGALKQYTDPTGEPTKVTNDGLGRPVIREYADGTFEEIHYAAARVDFTRDRQKREQHFIYDDGGRLSEVRNAGGVVLDHIDYENGRVIRWKTPDASTEFSDFDVDNHPRQITQHRLDVNGTEIDSYTITHTWNAAGELTHTGMPTYQGMPAGGRWATSLDYEHDANGNIRTILRNSAPLLTATFRGAGRPLTRNITLPNGSTLGRAYDYDDQTGSVGRRSGMRVTVGNTLFAGSSILFEGLQRKREQLLGLSGGERYTHYGYDDRGRVNDSIVATLDPNAIPQIGIPGAATVNLTDADFRSELNRTIVKQNDPPSTITTQSARGHKATSITRGAASETLRYQGADGAEVSVRTDDARYHYDFDEKEHLRTITEKLIPNGTQSRLIRVRYSFDGFGRIVGRRVEVAPVSNGQPPVEHDWTLATPDVVATQPLPAATSFVWDPVTDNLLAIFPEGASHTNAAPLRQFIHGSMAMDDPIEVVTADARLFPIFDEPGAGTLQAVISESGQLLARGLMGDPYGEQQYALSAPAVDHVNLTRNPDHSVQISLHATEPLDANTIASGTRLAALTANGTLIRTATTTATQPDPNTIAWTLTASDWTALTTNAASVSIAATSSLRSTTYGAEVPILPATPDMESTGNVFSSPTLPIEVREPIATIESQFISTGIDTPFTLATLTGLGAASSVADSLVLSSFQALPFVEPMTGFAYARERFYDPRTGNFLTSDPQGNIDSANLYAFAGGDPVNRRDPTGEDSYEDKYNAYLQWYSSQMNALWQKRTNLAVQIRKQRARTSDTGLLESEDNLLAQRMMTFGGTPDNAALLIDYARAHGRTDVLSMSFEQLHGAVMADEGVKNIGAAVVTAFGPHIAQTEGISFGGAWKRVKQFAGDAIEVYTESVFSSEAGAVGPSVLNKAKAADPFRAVPSRYRTNVRRAFGGVAKVEVTTGELVVFRRWGGKSGPAGSPWYSTIDYVKPGNARRYQALPDGNTAENGSTYVIRKGATILRGKTAAQVGVASFGPYATGGGEQVYVVNPADVRQIR